MAVDTDRTRGGRSPANGPPVTSTSDRVDASPSPIRARDEAGSCSDGKFDDARWRA